ncbi:diguanylate cyclase domain-containing protein [Halioxenophilus sp. WMMB6]|uniref:diguanylate cyclase domain-containing protein n=1 Tax=Halioxenophilus sp. WMMB6 TaxID=3073815 RepID=UPI00295E60C3|nr:diguanylate cyclase [Halioxenophilus sp. WMMB6]
MKTAHFSNSLVVKSLQYFALLVTVIGAISLAFNYSLASSDIKNRTLAQVEGLINTIEPSAKIAAYLNDRGLAREIARGLINNDIVYQVRLIDSEGDDLISMTNTRGHTMSGIETTRTIRSPFDNSVVVGQISIQLDQNTLDQQKFHYLVSVLTPIVLQTLAVIFAMVWAGWAVAMPRVKAFLAKLDKLDIETGEHLDIDEQRNGVELGQTARYINTLIDKMYQAFSLERALRRESEIQQRKMEAIFENARTGIFLADRDGKLLSYNHACQIISLRKGVTLTGDSQVQDILTTDIPETNEQIAKSLKNLSKLHLEIYLPGKNGHRETWLQLNLTPIDDHSIQGIINDISAVKSESIAAQTLARTDPLTKLGNRLGFEVEFNRRLGRTGSGQQSLTLMAIDLDRFKVVNDTLGHGAGDQVLRDVAQQLQKMTRANDYICRMGGDEFVILLDDINETISAKLAERIVEQLQEPIVLDDDHSAHIGASIGVVYVPANESACAEELLRRADKTMYKVKHSGRNNYAVVNFSAA